MRATVDRVAATLADLGHHVEKAGPVFDWDAFMLAHYRAWRSCSPTARPIFAAPARSATRW